MRTHWTRAVGILLIFALGCLVGSRKEQICEKIKKIVLFREKNSVLYSIKEHKPFVFIVPSFNNSKWVDKNLRSIFEQKYDNFRVIYIDDASNDGTLERAQKIISEYNQEHKVQLVHNNENCGALANIYKAIHSCLNQEIIVICDGDDWLAHEQVLQRLNEKYANPSVWGTYGSYVEYPNYSYTVANFAVKIPTKIIKKNQIRSFSKKTWNLSHLRTFYAGLFKKIHLEDLLYEGKYFDAAADVAIMIPIAEMAGDHLCYVDDILYIYNRASALNDHKVRAERQKKITEHILNRPVYSRIHSRCSSINNQSVHLVAFSFDRPLQLYALLESLDLHGRNLDAVTVIYRSSTKEYERGYIQVKDAFPHVHFLAQVEPYNDFKPLLMQALHNSPQEYLTCATDDIILTDEIDFQQGVETLEQTGAYCFSYRLGEEMDYCYMQDKHQDVPSLVPVISNICAWKFEEGQGDWNYKHSLDLTLYRKERLKKQWEALVFTHPNSLESAWALKAKTGGIGLCYTRSKMVNIPLNLVNISSNRHINSYSKEELLEKFLAGFKMDIVSLQRIEHRSVHSECPVQFTERKDL